MDRNKIQEILLKYTMLCSVLVDVFDIERERES